MKRLIDGIPGLESARPLTSTEIDGLRARGNRGDLDQIRLGAICRAEVLQAIRGSSFSGPCLLLGPPPLEIEGSSIRGAILGGVTIRDSFISESLLGYRVSVQHQCVIEGSVLLPYRRRDEGSTRVFGVAVKSSHVVDSVVAGGTKIGPFANVRSSSMVGPFAYLGTGSETKASCLFGATPRNLIELPHRSYFGNAAAKAVRIDAPFGTDEYLAELEQKLAALWLGDIQARIADEDVAGAIQPLERIRLVYEQAELVLEVEGVNLGALTTTSNFDPRNGGMKMPTNVEAGARFGILAMAEAPANVAPGVMVASGAKIGGANVPPGSLVLAGSGAEPSILPGYLERNRARLGSGVAESVSLCVGYLNQLRSVQRVLRLAGRQASGLERVLVSRSHLAVGSQIAELATWLHRFLDLIPLSAANLTRDLPTERDEARRQRIQQRLIEQRSVLNESQGYVELLGRLRDESHGESEELGAAATLEAVAREHTERWAARAIGQPDLARLLPSATSEEREAALERVRDASARFEHGALFGTSGIRGQFRRRHDLPATAAFDREGILTPALGYLAGRALGRLLGRRGEPRTAGIATDGRTSGPLLASSIRDGILEEGIRVVDLGVCTTPHVTAWREGLGVVVTASHNPADYNGIKVFLDGAPISRDVEEEVEQDIRLIENLGLCARWLPGARAAGARPRVIDTAAEQAQAHVDALRDVMERLKLVGELRGSRLPLDLAHGAAAAFVGEEMVVPSGPMRLLLEEGVVLVTYGGERDGALVNDRVGAAYLYGESRCLRDGAEVDVTPGPGETAALATGRFGYGAGRLKSGDAAGPPASRSVYWPAKLPLQHGLESATRPVEGGHRVFLDIDAQEHRAVRHRLESALATLPLLTALSVDGDADRTALVDPRCAQGGAGFIGGDELLMLFASHATEPIHRVVFTVESGIGLEKFFESRAIPFEVVTVGDRAVTECVMARAHLGRIDRAELLGGEPSGHLVIATKDGERFHIHDDPFVAHLRAIALARRGGKPLGTLLEELHREVKQVYTARKPDAWGRDPSTGTEGITLREKAALRLRATLNRGSLSDYAIQLIPAYLEQFGAAWATLFHGDGVEVATERAEEFEELRKGRAEPGPGKREVRVGVVQLKRGEADVESLAATLQMAGVEYFGPDDIVVRFYAWGAQGHAVKVGELVTRNSGTSAKNVAYHKLWPIHPNTGKRATPERLREVLEKVAQWRAEFTDSYVLEVLRSGTAQAR